MSGLYWFFALHDCHGGAAAQGETRSASAIRAWKYKTYMSSSPLYRSITACQCSCQTVVRPGRSFLRRMIILAKSKSQPSHLLRLNTSFRADLAWWALFLQQWNGISMMSAVGTHVPAHTLVSDASVWAFTDSAWFQVQWQTSSADYPIATKELTPIRGKKCRAPPFRLGAITQLCGNQLSLQQR